MNRFICTLLALAIVGCTPVHKFTPTATHAFEPQALDTEIAVLETMPEREHVVLGYAESRGADLSDAMPQLLKLAREAGGNAIVNIQSAPFGMMGLTIQIYRCAVIRYTEGS